jgi:hypothetical protein
VLETIRAKVAERVGRGGEEDGRDEYARIVESICGAVDDSQAIEQYGRHPGCHSGLHGPAPVGGRADPMERRSRDDSTPTPGT